MQFGLHYLLSCADGQSPVERYRDTLEQAASAEALGFESVWPVEHHFHGPVSISPCPTLLLAAVAARTRTLRLGTAIVQLPLAHPLRVAEEIATLDVLSGGRVEFGVGRGGKPTHCAGVCVPMYESRDRMGEARDYGRRAWTEERFTFRGRFFEADGLTLAPRPVQRPHPPVSVAANSAETAEWAGRAGYPVLMASIVIPFARLRELVPVYRRARAAAEHADAPNGGDLTLLVPLYVGASRRRVEQEVAPSVRHFAATAGAAAAGWVAKAPEAERAKLAPLLEQMRRMTYETVSEGAGIFGTPAACVERLHQLREELNPGRVICWFNFGGLVPHRQVMRSMELFSARVMPHV
jgi:alkanesulfonate monooxygenase SsuD/methylene tetrahydromethanopterin reductase-like flavin-dependent oxidoreductase (luciferase family)